jgi:multidrug efflux system membrane fusion protein
MDPHPRGSQAPVRRFAGRAAALAALALLLAACGKPAPVDEPVRAVKLLTVGEGRLASGHEFAGEVRPRVESRLGFRVAGKITQRQARGGTRPAGGGRGSCWRRLMRSDYKLAADAGRGAGAAAGHHATAIWRRPTTSALRP